MSQQQVRYSTSMYIGETTGGVPQPVFFDTHTPIFNNKPPGILVTGSPGAGKTFFALTMTALSTMLGKTTVVLDPKGDFISLYNLQDQLGKITLWNLGTAGVKSKAGVLDPFYMASTPGEQLTLVISVIDLFVGGLTDQQMTVLAPIVKDVIEMPVPSLQKVVENLRGSTRPEARDLGTKLDIISQMSSAKLCFSPGNKKQGTLSIDKGLTVVTLVGMDLPADAEEARSTNQGRLASGILFLLTDFIRRIMHSDTSNNPKSLIIDEAWSVLSSKQGADVVKAVSLLGRSKGVSLMLVTQNASHLKNLDIDTTITTRFAFRTAQKEAADIVEAMDLPPGEGFENILTGLNNGECLMQDFRGRSAKVQITTWRQDWTEAFNTNPYDKARKKIEKEKAEAAARLASAQA